MIISPKTDTNLRSENQDVFGHFETPYGSLLVVCDGMGGARAGHQAADYTASRLPQLLAEQHARSVPVVEALQEAVAEINRRVYELGNGGDPEFRGMGTTLVFALDTGQGFLIGHVGDSRAYLHRKGSLKALTQDHAPVADMLARGIITHEQARVHPRRSVLSRAVGSQTSPPLELREFPVQLGPGESLLLCSDGLCGFVSDEEICVALDGISDKRDAGSHLVDLAKRHGSDDNITVLLGHIPERVSPQTLPAADRTATFPSGRATGPKPRPSTLSGRRRDAVLEEATSPWFTLILLVFFLILGIAGTVSHYRNVFHVAPYQPLVEGKIGEAVEVDVPADYDWEEQDCEMSFAEKGKSLLSDFEMELRKSTAINTEEELELGRNYASEIDLEYAGMVDIDRKWTAYINRVGQHMTNYTRRDDMAYVFHYIDDPTENAFAVPGGHIYIFRGLLENRIHNEAQLAFVLAHEIKHVDNHHTVAFERLLRKLPMQMQSAAGNAVQYYINQPFSMKREEEADFEALQMIMEAGYSPFQAVLAVEELAAAEAQEIVAFDIEDDFLKSLQQEMRDLLSTHPNTRRRACQIRNQVLHLLRLREPKSFYVGETNYYELVPMFEQMY